MDYIINPIWFYVIDVVSKIGTFCTLLAFFATASVIACIIYRIVEADYWDSGDDNAKAWQKIIRVSVICAVAFWFLVILIPTREVMIEMMIAKLATKTNAANAVEAIKSAVDYIVQAIDKLK